ncbi:MAG: response regulator transcription factor [Oscillospiraceae bacterium]|nr:response regulator transcription factor [Oscillospiraceae bacterium]
MYRMLIADDEQKIRAVLREYAEFEGHDVEEAVDGMQAVEICRNAPRDFDIIILDVMMPKLDGFSACKEIRKFSDTPVLMLSARGEEYDKLFAFEIGADDYVVKPFSPKEVLARINAIIKRSNIAAVEPTCPNIENFEGLEINFLARDVKINGNKINLTPKEYDLLFYLAKNKNIALSRNKLLEDVWGYDFFGDDRTIDTHIKMLRNSLGEYRKFIVTMRSMGYKFVYEELF